MQRLPVQTATQHQGVGSTDTELGGDVLHDAVIGGRCRRQYGSLGPQLTDQGADPPVVGTEVVTPVRHTMGFVDHHQARVGSQGGQHRV